LIALSRTLRKDRLPGFLERLLAEREVFAPRHKEDRVVLEKIDSPGDAVLEYGNTKESPKFALFPQRETLFGYRAEKGKVELKVPRAKEKGQVLFGIRPCDARGLLLLDRVFGGDCSDPYYEEKRAKTLVVSLGCVHPNPTCFCRSTGGGPCSPEGSDLFFLDLGDRFLVEAVTDNGAALLEEAAFEDADEAVLALGEKIKTETWASMKPPALKKTSKSD
jgi:sulfhydrogenase subunit beta (sulfur reductase)